jgi:hypothetical protein
MTRMTATWLAITAVLASSACARNEASAPDGTSSESAPEGKPGWKPQTIYQAIPPDRPVPGLDDAKVQEALAGESKPNIVLMMTDNVGWGEIGTYGGGILRGAETPRIDSLATDGMKLALNVAAMLIAFIALIALANALIGLPFALYNDWMGLEGAAAVEPWTMQKVLGWIFWPFAFLIGVPASECAAIGTLLGEKLVLTEFIAYLHLYETLSEGAVALSPRTVVMASYALCGFANFGSIGIQLGGIGGIAPERRHDLARLGLKAMFGGMLASLMTASVAGFLY